MDKLRQSIKEFNIYCDETRVENRDSNYMVIGALVVPRQEKDRAASIIKELKERHEFHQEIKWNKVGESFAEFYRQLLLKFVEDDSLTFRAIIVDKSKIKFVTYHENDEELAFFKFYYILLRELLNDSCHYYIFLDKKPTRDKNRARALKAFLDSHVLLHRDQSQIQHLQAYESHENTLMQLSDLITGLIGFINNGDNSGTKKQLTDYFQELTDVSLLQTTPKSSKKINLLKWIPKE